MATRDGRIPLAGAARQGRTTAEQNDLNIYRGSGGPAQVTHNYFGPVNHVGEVNGSNFGINHGLITNNTAERSAAILDNQKRETLTSTVPRLPNGQIDLFAMLNPIPDASHSRNIDLSPPHSQCFHGTRKSVLKKIRSWVNSSLIFDNPHILWVYGYAGCGKSAVALAIAKHFAGEKRLAGSFFFFRGTNRSSVARFATTVAHQIAVSIPATAPFIEAALSSNPALVTKDTPVEAQFEALVYGPIDSVKWDKFAASLRNGPYLIVFDGVDECEDRQAVANFIEHMIQYFEKKPRTPLRILVTSRVEDHLHRRLHSSTQVQLLDLVNDTSDSDISAALDVAIANEKRGLVLTCADSWPSPEDKAKLVEHIGGSYIFMTTIVKLLFDPNIRDGRTPMERLPLVLSTHPDFDDLYRTILEPCQNLPHFHDIISVIALAKEPLSIAQIGDLLDIKAASVANVLINLNAVMHIPGDDRTPVTLWHTSLRDFFTCKGRSGSFFVSHAHHHRLAYPRNLKDMSPAFQYFERYAFHHLEKLVISIGSDLGMRVCDKVSVVHLLNSPTFRDGYTALQAAYVNVRFNDRGRRNFVTALHAACTSGRDDIIYLLLDNGANPNIASDSPNDPAFVHATPLTCASVLGDVKVVTRLLECGADPNLQVGQRDTALQAACYKSMFGVVNLLLKNGADPNLTGGLYGSALHACVWDCFGYVSCARALLEYGADTNVRENRGHNTPLHDACASGNSKIAELLLDFGADPSSINVFGLTPLQEALKDHSEDSIIVQTLRRRGVTE
ncbi:hypothetical protein NMY22_g9245 [Coprinellus aureogranulatus]|nr:hypothetical protein NMY22_g9245 [Coprinellus aureogranulatus]